MSNCIVNLLSSAACSRGTKSCVVGTHDEDASLRVDRDRLARRVEELEREVKRSVSENTSLLSDLMGKTHARDAAIARAEAAEMYLGDLRQLSTTTADSLRSQLATVRAERNDWAKTAGTAQSDAIAAWDEINALRAKLQAAEERAGAMEHERDAYRATVCDLLAAAHPHPTEHPTMAREWDRAREVLKTGVYVQRAPRQKAGS